MFPISCITFLCFDILDKSLPMASKDDYSTAWEEREGEQDALAVRKGGNVFGISPLEKSQSLLPWPSSGQRMGWEVRPGLTLQHILHHGHNLELCVSPIMALSVCQPSAQASTSNSPVLQHHLLLSGCQKACLGDPVSLLASVGECTESNPVWKNAEIQVSLQGYLYRGIPNYGTIMSCLKAGRRWLEFQHYFLGEGG